MPKVYILQLWYFFFLLFSMPYFWYHWTDLNQTWTHINLWLLFEIFGLNSPGIYPVGWGQKKLLGTNFEFWLNISLQRNMISTIGKNLSIYRDIQHFLFVVGFLKWSHFCSWNQKSKGCAKPYMPLKFGELWSRNGWEQLENFGPSSKFLHWETLPVLRHRPYITDLRPT